MNALLNPYGDESLPTTGTHGIDIASQRMDELDRECIRFALDQNTPLITVDLGCGRGTQSFRMGTLGSEVWMYDLMNINASVSTFNTLMGAERLHFLHKDATQLTEQDIPRSINIFYSQRFIHYLRYEAAKKVILLFATKMAAGSRMFLSASGLQSELGQGYAHSAMAIDDRYSPLEASIAEKHQIHEPVCLYEEQDIVRLGESAGLRNISIKKSAFGNIKGIFTR